MTNVILTYEGASEILKDVAETPRLFFNLLSDK